MGLVRLSHLADGDLDAIRDSIAPHNPSAANAFLEQLFHTPELLATQPLIGQSRDDLALGLRAFTLRQYVILYRPADNGIYVARFVHGARDFPAMFRDDTIR